MSTWTQADAVRLANLMMQRKNAKEQALMPLRAVVRQIADAVSGRVDEDELLKAIIIDAPDLIAALAPFTDQSSPFKGELP